MLKVRRFFAVFLIFGLFSANWHSASAQAGGNRYFSETGHNVSGEFLTFYESNPNAIFLYGYPITEEFTSKDGKTVQYFQRARFEYDASLPEGSRVRLTPLGNLTYQSTGNLNINNPFACRVYETGYSVCFEFLEFFEAHGGVTQFGNPISGFEYHENKLVQYFENARIEWQPWKPEGQRVVVSDLGRMYFDQLGEDAGLLPPVKPRDNTLQQIIKIHVSAFVWKAIVLPSDSQMIFVVVLDQNLQPVANVSCTSSLRWADGRVENYALTTNAKGIGILSFAFVEQKQGSLVYVDVACNYSGLNGATNTSFRIWY